MPDLVNLELLAAVAILSEEGSYSGAAERLGITPSLLKRKIADLENQLEFRIFQTYEKRLTLSKQGKTLVQVSRVFLTEIGQIKNEEALE